MLTPGWNIVLSLPNGLTPGGMTTWTVRTADALATRGRRVVIMTHEPPANAAVIDTAALGLHANVSIQQQPSLASEANWEPNLAAYSALLPAVLVPTTIEQSFEIAAALALNAPSQIRVVGWNHSDHEYDYACLTHIEPACERYIVNTAHCAAQLAERLPYRAEQIVRVPHIVDSGGGEREARTDDVPLRIGYAGRLEASAKRVGDLVTIAERLRDAGVAFSLRIMGDGPMRRQLTDRIEQFNATNGERRTPDGTSSPQSCEIQLLPPAPPTRINEFWRSCDCLLLPSAYEGLNLQMLEAMANGCVPIVTAIPSGPADFVRHGSSGMTFPVGDCGKAAECVEALANDRAKLRRMAKEASATIARQCNAAVTTEQLITMLDDVITSSPRPWPRTRSISMRAEMNGEACEVADGLRRMDAAFKHVSDCGGRAVAIYGAGRYSQSLAAAFAHSPVPIRAFIDDDPQRQGERLWNWPIVSRENALSTEIDAVIISSRMNESQMLSHRPGFAAAGIEMIALYATEPRSGATSESAACEGRRVPRPAATRLTAGAVGT